jgi:circadian clock protein KaiB
MNDAIENIRKICKEDLKGTCTLEIIDIKKHPELAISGNVFAVPTLVRKLPPSLQRIVGDLSDKEKVLVGLKIEEKHSF